MTWLHRVLQQKPLAEAVSMQSSSGPGQQGQKENSPLVTEPHANSTSVCPSHRGKTVRSP